MYFNQIVRLNLHLKFKLVKLSPRAISIGLLNNFAMLICLQIRPINPLTLGGPYFFRMGSLILGLASRLDAFSVYLFRR